MMSTYQYYAEEISFSKKKGIRYNTTGLTAQQSRRYNGATRYRFKLSDVLNDDNHEIFDPDKLERTFKKLVRENRAAGRTGFMSCSAYIPEWLCYARVICNFNIITDTQIVWAAPESSPYDQTTIRKFSIFWWGTTDEAGGKDINNDCLWTAIRISTNYQKLRIRQPDLFKFKLNLERDDLVPMDMIKQVEEELRVNINCDLIGDDGQILKRFESKKRFLEFPQVINLQLKDNHYSFKTLARSYLSGFLFRKRRVVFYKKLDDETYAYELESGRKMTVQEYKDYYHAEQIDADAITLVALPARQPSFEAHRKIYDEVGALLKKSTQSYNLYLDQDLCPTTHQLSLTIFKYLSGSHGVMEPMDAFEDMLVKKTNRGGLHYAVPGTYENAYELDVNGFYSFIMRDLEVPMCAPTVRDPASLAKPYPLGLYKVYHHGSNHENSDYYTNYDLMGFDLIGKGYTITEAYVYDNSAKLFKDFVNYFEELKPAASEPTKKYLKLVQNTLWGALCGRVQHNRYISDPKIMTELEADEEIVEMTLSGHDNIKVVLKKEDSLNYKHEWARIGPFITSAGQYFIRRLLQKHMANVKYINTDGFVFCSGFAKGTKEDKKARESLKASMNLMGTSIGTKLGEFKVPALAKTCIIKNKNQKKFID